MNKNHAVALLISFAVGVATWTVARSAIENKRLNEGFLDSAESKNSISEEAKNYETGDYYVDLTDEEPSSEGDVVEITVTDSRTPEDIDEAPAVIHETTFSTPDDVEADEDEDFKETPATDGTVKDVAIIIGDGEGHISRTSKEYEDLIEEAVLLSSEDPSHTLTLHGKLNGLGARGVKTGVFVTDSEGVEFEGKSYDAVAIQKLHRTMLDKKN